MPDPALAFTDQFDALLARARAGDGIAACRLALEAMRCDAAYRQRAFAAMMEQSLAGNGTAGDDHRQIDFIARSRERADEAAGTCGNAESPPLPAPDTYLADIAAVLPVRARVILAMTRKDGSLLRLPRATPSNPRVMHGRSTDYVVPQFLADNDMRFLDAGIAAGDPLALEGMLLVHAPSVLPGASPSPLRQARPDPSRYAYHALLMQRLYGEEALGRFAFDLLTRVRASHTDAQREALERRVDTEVERWRGLHAADTASLPDAETPTAAKCAA